MLNDNLQQTYNAYLEAYDDIAIDERERLLRQSVTEDIIFTNPNADNQGFGNLMEHIQQFQNQRKGASFKSTSLLSHHGQFLSEWTMYNNDGTALVTAHSYGRFNEQGLITAVVGFF